MGTTLLYHGHRVSLEWQSKQLRFRTAPTSGGTVAAAWTDCAASIGGLVLSGRKSCMPAKTMASPITIRFSRVEVM